MAFPTRNFSAKISRADLNSLNRLAKPVISDIRLTQRRWMERIFIRHLSPSEFMVLSALVARTLAWTKVIEVVPLSVLSQGMLAEDQTTLLVNEYGLPYFAGTGLDRVTIRKAVAGLLEHGVIDRYALSVSGRDVFAYVPLSVRTLLVLMTAHASIPDAAVPDVFKQDQGSMGELEAAFHLGCCGDYE